MSEGMMFRVEPIHWRREFNRDMGADAVGRIEEGEGGRCESVCCDGAAVV